MVKEVAAAGFELLEGVESGKVVWIQNVCAVCMEFRNGWGKRERDR